MIVKFVGNKDSIAFEYGKLYEVISEKHGTYEIMSELDESYYLPPNVLEVIEE